MSGRDTLVETHRLPTRTADPLFDAVLGLRVTRPAYLKRTELEGRTATRDLQRLTESGLLTAHGQTRGRYYTGGEELISRARSIRAGRAPLHDPYPELMDEIKALTNRKEATHE